jgi:hypothetical protein
MNAHHYKIGVTYTDAVPVGDRQELSDFYRGDIPKEQTTAVSGGYGSLDILEGGCEATGPDRL